MDKFFKNKHSLAVVFVLSRVLFYLAGIRFDYTTLDYFSQFIDYWHLRYDLFESLFYFHAQPPLFNLFLGIGIKLFPNSYGIFFNIVYLIIGLVIVYQLQKLLSLVSKKESLVNVLTIIWIISPFSVFYENWLFYTYPVLLLILLMLNSFTKYTENYRVKYFAFTLLYGSAIVLIRSMFHLGWLVIIACFMVYIAPRDTLKKIVLALLIIMLPFSVYLKNFVVFDKFSSSTWMGMSLAKMTTMDIPEDTVNEYIGNSELSEISLIRPFSAVEEYQKIGIIPNNPFSDIDILSNKKKLFSEKPNFNHYSYILISDRYQVESMKILFNNPGYYLDKSVESWFCWFLPVTENGFFQENQSSIRFYDQLWNRVIWGQYLSSAKFYEPREKIGRNFFSTLKYIRFHIVLFILISILGLIKWLFVSFKKDRKEFYFVCFALFNVMYVTFLGNALEFGENNRFRFLILPLLMLGFFREMLPLFSRIVSKIRK